MWETWYLDKTSLFLLTQSRTYSPCWAWESARWVNRCFWLWCYRWLLGRSLSVCVHAAGWAWLESWKPHLELNIEQTFIKQEVNGGKQLLLINFDRRRYKNLQAATEPTSFSGANSNSSSPLSATRQRSPPHCRDAIIRMREVIIRGHFTLHDGNKHIILKCDMMHTCHWSVSTNDAISVCDYFNWTVKTKLS